jgi:integrase
MTWVQRQLGHSSITMTVDRYGHWERRAEKVQAARLEGAFAIS